MPSVPPPEILPTRAQDLPNALSAQSERTKNRLRRAPDVARERPKRVQEAPYSAVDDLVVGSILVLVAVLYFLALFSYDPHDLPTWAPFNPTDTQNLKPANYIGTTGALGAFYSVMLAGMATYLLPFSLMWFGVCKLTTHSKVTMRHWLGVVFVLLAGASIIDLMGWDFGQGQITPLGNGGAIGCLVGGKIALNVLGPVGSLLVLSLFYFTGLVFVTGLHPVQVLASARREIPEMWRWMLARLAPIAEDEPEVTQQQAVLEAGKRKGRGKTATTSSVGSSTATEPPVELFVAQDLPLSFEPEPKIIDSSASKVMEHDDTRPKLADVWAKKRQQKIEQTGPAPSGSLTERFKDYVLPSLDLLNWADPELAQPADPAELRDIQDTIVRCLNSFQISVTKGDITRGPAITRYEVRPVDGLRVSRIATLEPDIARATKAERINILAPIPGKDTVGIEIANKHKVLVPVRELLEDETFQNGKSKLPIALGKDVYGKTIIADLAAMPHLLVAGATGSGKSVCINSIITSLICRFAPDELRFIMIDPKVVEMQTYAELPHLALPVVTDPKKALLALRWVVREMEARYQIFAQEGCRNFDTFNSRNRKKAAASRTQPAPGTSAKLLTTPPKLSANDEVVYQASDQPLDNEEVSIGFVERHHISIDEPLAESDDLDADAPPWDANGDWAGDSEPPPTGRTAPHRHDALIIPDTMPYVVVIIDELADLMQTAPADIEVAIARITQMARAAGIHLIVATQTPRADVITGVIKANVPSRIAFQVASSIDSRVILDRKGAEKLVGKGDMLYLPPGTANLVRSQGAFVTDEEIHALVSHCVTQGKPVFESGGETLSGPSKTSFGDEEDEDEEGADNEDERVLEKCLEVIRQEKKASTSLLQRRLGLGYTRAARMMDVLEERGIIGPGEGAKPRDILVRLD